jgi:hypothetical protein
VKKNIIIITIILYGISISAQEIEILNQARVNFQKTWENTLTDITITIKVTNSKIAYLMQKNIKLDSIASELIRKYTVPIDSNILFFSVSPEIFKATAKIQSSSIVSKQITNNGDFEIIYADGRKVVWHCDPSKEDILHYEPRNDTGKWVFISTNVASLHAPKPTDNNYLNEYLLYVNTALTDFIYILMNEDASFIGNFKKNDTGLNLYENIFRRLDFINWYYTKNK